MSKQQTAVEWLVHELLDGKPLMPSLIEQAKQMEKHQIIKAFAESDINVFKTPEGPFVKIKEGELYYNKFYGK